MNKRLMSSLLIGTMSLSALAGCSRAPAESAAGNVSTPAATTAAAVAEGEAKNNITIEKKIGDISKEDESKFRQGYLDFTFEMLKQNLERDGKNSNIMISPASLMLALDMTASGASGNTLTQMTGLYGGAADPQGQLSYASELFNRMNSANGVKLRAADSIWVNKEGMPEGLKDDYVDFVKKFFDAEIASLVFDDSALNRINGWVSEKTDKMIPSILDSLDPSTVMVLINAISFDGKWAKAYEDYDVTEGVFTSASGDKQKANMMSSTEEYYLENDKTEGFIKYYEGDQYAFVVMLPKDANQNAGDIISGFTGESFDEYINSATSDYLLLTKMPEFSSDWGRSVVPDLQALGMQDPFNPSAADFSGINGMGGLFISNVIHKTHIEVNREGTRAAAVTAVTMDKCEAIDTREVKEVVCDRPFAYAIVDTTDNTPVFIGTVNNI